MLNINGEILSRDKAIVRIENGIITDSDQALLPLFLKRTGDVEAWLSGRAIDSHRTNSRLLKKALRISNAEDAEVALKVHAATITDTYWFRESGAPCAMKMCASRRICSTSWRSPATPTALISPIPTRRS